MNAIYLSALFAGAAIALQAAMNARLGSLLGSPLLASCVAFAGGIVFSVIAVLALQRQLPARALVSAVPTYLWLGGGLLSALGISTLYFLIPKLGMGQLMALALTGQLLVAMLVGHFGWFELPHRPVNGIRLLGVVALLAGVLLINWDAAKG